MISIRSIGRATPRSLTCVSCPRASIQRRLPLLQSLRKLPQSHASFSTSIINSSKSSGKLGDSELIKKLSSELRFENEMIEDLNQPTSIKDYLENGPFDVIDEPGKDEVILNRTYGQEKYCVFIL